MSSEFDLGRAGIADQTSGSLSISAGSMLRQAREAAGLHVAALAVSMKVPVKKLEALEADRLDLLPDLVFVRALASSVCRALKIDPIPVLGKLPPSGLPRLVVGEKASETTFQPFGGIGSSSVRSFLAKPAVLGVLALLIGVLGLLFFPDLQKQESSVDVSHLPTIIQPEVPVIVSQHSEDGAIALATPALPLAVDPVPTTMPSAQAVEPLPFEAPATLPQKANAELAPVASVSQTLTANVAVVGNPSSNVISFKANANSWVQVVDSKGGVQLSRTLSSGELVAVGGVPPLSVIVGRVDAVDVEVRGKSFSLSSIGIDNVARFEVK